MIWESLGVLPAPAPSPTPTPEGAALKAQVKLRFGNPQEEYPDPGSSSAQEEPEPQTEEWIQGDYDSSCYPEAWDVESSSFCLAYGEPDLYGTGKPGVDVD